MVKRSAGLLMYRRREAQVEVFLVHPGGPFWVKKDAGAWSIPKGEYLSDEPALEAAIREFHEETGFTPAGPYLDLGSATQSGGKVVSAWAFEGDCNPAKLASNLARIEWPPRSGRHIDVPEIDRGDWFGLAQAQEKILKGQHPLLDTFRSLVCPIIEA